MSKRSAIVAVGCALLTLTVLGTGAKAWSVSEKSYLTFSGPVSLPGVTLGGGTYVFERASDAGLVLVRDRTTSEVRYLGFTLQARRPAGLAADQQITLRESPKGVAPRIDAWYPNGESTGAQFMYPKSN
jgi:hypothetical protein